MPATPPIVDVNTATRNRRRSFPSGPTTIPSGKSIRMLLARARPSERASRCTIERTLSWLVIATKYFADGSSSSLVDLDARRRETTENCARDNAAELRLAMKWA
eukprot:scaffold132273_cov37-Tisochrysis_lutea.AAC.3